MISCAAFEQPGRWRMVGIALAFLVALAPALALLTMMEASALAATATFSSAFVGSLARSMRVACAVVGVSVVVGLPTGVFASVYAFPLRRLLLALLALPLLVPSFISAIGLSMLRRAFDLSADSLLSGFAGTVLTFALFGTPLVMFITLASARSISRSQMDAARLAGGERHLFHRIVWEVFPASALTGVLAGVLTLSDPGPGQILGYSGVASEILVSLAAQYDFAAAARQCVSLAGVVLVIGLPVALLLAPRLASGLLARDTTFAPLARGRAVAGLGPVLFTALLVLTVALPLAGFLQPLFRSFPADRAMREVGRTLGNTFSYAAGASALATMLGVGLAVCAGRSVRLRIISLVGLLLVFALPPALGALGLIQLAGASSAQLDPVLRGPFTVSLALALRFFPVAAVFAMRRLGSTSPSWAAAAVHGVSLTAFGRKVLVPWLASAALPAALLIALLATADVSSVLLLHPPGKGSLPLAIFTVMANAPEALVGALCLAYVGGAALLLGLGWLATISFSRQS